MLINFFILDQRGHLCISSSSRSGQQSLVLDYRQDLPGPTAHHSSIQETHAESESITRSRDCTDDFMGRSILSKKHTGVGPDIGKTLAYGGNAGHTVLLPRSCGGH